MKYFAPPLALLALTTISPAQTPEATFDQLVCHEQHAAANGISSAATSNAADNYDLVYQRCEWHVDPAVQYISGVVTAHFKPRADGVPRIEFDLKLNLTVDSVHYHGQSVAFSHDTADVLAVPLPGLSAGVLDSLTIYYRGAPEADNGFGSFVTSTHDDGTVPVLWTLSEPYGARDWWPTKQDLVDKIDSIDVFVTTIAAYRVASNGLLMSETPFGPGLVRYHWRHRYPIAAYLVAIAVTNYSVYTDLVATSDADTLRVINYVYPESLADAMSGTSHMATIVPFFRQLAGPYPFAAEKYGHAQFGWGGGMEHQTMSFVTNYNFDLLAHELAHQWFGDKITPGSWAHIWLNEGFATYFQGLTLQYYGFEPWYWPLWKKQRVTSITSQPGGSVYVTDTTDVARVFSSRLSYSKGAWLLHMLRWRYGDSTFFSAIRAYAVDTALCYRYAFTDDFQQHLETATGEDLDAYFADWFYGEGYPSYHVRWDQGTDLALTVELSQTASMPSSVDFFENPVPLRLMSAGGDSLDVVIDHTMNGQLATFAVPFAIDTIRVDPDYWLISGGNTVEKQPGVPTHAPPSPGGIRAFPNPFDDAFTVRRAGPVAGARLRVCDARGQVVLEREWSGNVPAQQIDLSGLPPGMYAVVVGNRVVRVMKGR